MKEKTIVVKVFVINTEGLILVLRRGKDERIRPLEWDLPGGGVEYGEDPTAAAIREVEEETGLIIDTPKVFLTKTTSQNKYVVKLIYYVHADSKSILLSSEHDDYKWVTKEAFSQLATHPHYKECLNYLPM
ncbi:MAG TPA: NUDIX domain-containing protein [Candidatus Saccharimonadales bacterium]|jgi:8-oxo-dGTP diphosphatase|nr:NUDIX domain-containing protein [Candidatus Saccharimonadales bacterium]